MCVVRVPPPIFRYDAHTLTRDYVHRWRVHRAATAVEWAHFKIIKQMSDVDARCPMPDAGPPIVMMDYYWIMSGC